MLDNPHELAVDSQTSPQQPELRLSGTVLLAEDGLDNQQLLSAYLRRAGCEVVIAGNGRIACDTALEAAGAGRPFDVILMDMQMPKLDGYGAAALLRAKGYPGAIVALTAHAMSEDREKCLQSGCTDYLTKPVSRHALLETIAKYLRPGAAAEETLQSTADDEDMLKLLPRFIERLPRQVSDMLDLLHHDDLKPLADAIHQLKGTGGLFGFNKISEFAGNAEQALKRSDSVELIERKVQELISIVRCVQGYDRSSELADASRVPESGSEI
jgi:CheY-like chemotaxis protein/HPt (histidine-containing phosphotransfer) domain-containing protein